MPHPRSPEGSGPAAAALGAAAALLALGCAHPTQPAGMTPALWRPPGAAPERTVDIQTVGGHGTNPLGRSQISNADFTQALATALIASGLLTPVVDKPGDYHLDVDIEDLDQSHFSFPMTAHLVAHWSLRRRGEREAIWTESIDTTHTVPLHREINGRERLRMATEGTARLNIERALVRLAEHLDRERRTRPSPSGP